VGTVVPVGPAKLHQTTVAPWARSIDAWVRVRFVASAVQTDVSSNIRCRSPAGANVSSRKGAVLGA